MSSSEEDIMMLAVYTAYRRVKRKQRQWWIHPLNKRRLQQGSFNNLRDLEDEDKFRCVYRMSRALFSDLVEKVRPNLQRQDTRLRLSVPVEEKLLICLRYLATGSSFRSLSIHFLRGETTIGGIVKEVTKEIWDVLYLKYMPVPNQEEWESISMRFFHLWNIPNCLGAIDGKHIRIKKPRNTGSTFINYKGYFSVILMAVADADGNFIAIDVGDYGRNSDGKVFSNCPLGKMINRDLLNFPPDVPLPGTPDPMPHFFVADEAFPLSKRIMRPYPGNQLPEDRRAFNYRLSRARKVIECAFGMLVSKFRCFDTPLACQVETVDSVVKSACILHNYIRKQEGRLAETVYNNGPGNDLRSVRQANREVNGIGKCNRDKLKDYFTVNPIPPQECLCRP